MHEEQLPAAPKKGNAGEDWVCSFKLCWPRARPAPAGCRTHVLMAQEAPCGQGSLPGGCWAGASGRLTPHAARPGSPRLLTWWGLGAGDVGRGWDHAGRGGQVAGGWQRGLRVQRPEFLEDRVRVRPGRGRRPGSPWALAPPPAQAVPQPQSRTAGSGWGVGLLQTRGPQPAAALTEEGLGCPSGHEASKPAVFAEIK